MNIIGIPDRAINTDIPESSGELWDYVIHRHEADVAGLHYDLRLSPPGSNIAYSWAIPKATLPSPYEKILAVKQPDHTREYMGWAGEIEDGYGKGKVTIAESGKAEVLHSAADKLTFNIYTGTESKRFNLIRTGDKNWILLNYSPTRNKRALPDYKPRYTSLNIDDVELDKGDEFFAPKLDGAHALIQIRKGHGLDVFSYRPSKRSSTNLIDHTFKTELGKIKPINIDKTILRAEIYGRDRFGKAIPSAQTGGLLNASVPKSRELQKERGFLDNTVFDVIQYEGKNVENLPYERKLEILKEITNKIPELHMPELAETLEDKQKMLERIRSGKHPDTDEGIIIYKKNKPVPYRAKIKNDFDVYVTGIFEGAGKYAGRAAGGFTYSLTRGGKTVGRVGSGFTDEERVDMWNNQEDYIGRVAKVVTERKYHTGSLRIPIFKEWRYELFNKTALEQKFFMGTMRKFRDGKFIGQSVLNKVYSNIPIDVGRWTITLNTLGHRKGYLK